MAEGWLVVWVLFDLLRIFTRVPIVLVDPLIITRSLSIYLLRMHLSVIACMLAVVMSGIKAGNPRALEHTLEDPSFIDWEV